MTLSSVVAVYPPAAAAASSDAPQEWGFSRQLWKRVAQERRRCSPETRLALRGLLAVYLAAGVLVALSDRRWALQVLGAMAAWTWLLAPLAVAAIRHFELRRARRSELLEELRLTSISQGTLAKIVWLQASLSVLATAMAGIFIICCFGILILHLQRPQPVFEFLGMYVIGIWKIYGFMPFLLLGFSFIAIEHAQKIWTQAKSKWLFSQYIFEMMFTTMLYLHFYQNSLPKVWKQLFLFLR
jgi:hypothetical protein